MNTLRMKDLDEEEVQKKIDFLKENNIHLVNFFQATELDYRIFIECMGVYLEKHENYFPRYKEFYTSIQNQHLEEGIKGFYKAKKKQGFSTSNILDEYEEAIMERIQHMDFFGIEEINDYTKADYQVLLQKALSTEFGQEIDEVVDEEELRIEKYFNFKKFNIEVFETLFQEAIQSFEGKKYTFSQLDRFDKGSYIIISYAAGVPVRIATTDQPFKWAKGNQEEESFGLFPVDKEYIKELKVKLCLYYPTIKAYSAMIQITNKMYANLKQAKRVYQNLNGLNLVHLKQIIEINNIDQHFVGGATVIEKAVLDYYVQEFLKLKDDN